MWMSVLEAARYAHCGNDAFRALVAQGKIPSYPSLNGSKRGHRVVSTEDVDAYVRSQGACEAVPGPDAVPARVRASYGKAVA